MAKKLKVGELIYLKGVGFPFDGRGNDGYESMEGASAIVKKLNTGSTKDYVSVEFVFPIKNNRGRLPMKDCLFHPEQCVRENRPWLKKNLTAIFKAKKQMILAVGQFIDDLKE